MVKDVVTRAIYPWVLTTITMTASSLVMLIIALLMGKKPFQNMKQGIILGFMLACILLPQGMGMKYTTASNSGFITGLFIVFVPFVNFFVFGKKPTRAVFYALPLALLGLWFLTGGITGFNKGDGLTLITAVACAFHVLYANKIVKNGVDATSLSFQQYATTAVCALILALCFGNWNIEGSFKLVSVMAYLVFLPNCLAFFLQFKAQKFVAPFKVSLLFLSESVFAAIFAWTLGSEPFLIAKAAGGLLIVSGMVIVDIGGKKEDA